MGGEKLGPGLRRRFKGSKKDGRRAFMESRNSISKGKDRAFSERPPIKPGPYRGHSPKFHCNRGFTTGPQNPDDPMFDRQELVCCPVRQSPEVDFQDTHRAGCSKD